MNWNNDEWVNVADFEHHIMFEVLGKNEYNEYVPGIRQVTDPDHGDVIELNFRYTRTRIPDKTWNKVLDYLKEDWEIVNECNEYESNYDPGEPPEWVPTIRIKYRSFLK